MKTPPYVLTFLEIQLRLSQQERAALEKARATFWSNYPFIQTVRVITDVFYEPDLEGHIVRGIGAELEFLGDSSKAKADFVFDVIDGVSGDKLERYIDLEALAKETLLTQDLLIELLTGPSQLEQIWIGSSVVSLLNPYTLPELFPELTHLFIDPAVNEQSYVFSRT